MNMDNIRKKNKVVFGQNFLTNKDIAVDIVDSCNFSDDDVLEIGPGEGILTGLIAERVKTFTIIEIDPFYYNLNNFHNSSFRIIRLPLYFCYSQSALNPYWYVPVYHITYPSCRTFCLFCRTVLYESTLFRRTVLYAQL